MKIEVMKLFCPLCGRELEKYEINKFSNECYAFCSNCNREYIPSLAGKSGEPQSLFFYWKDGDKRMWDLKKKHEAREGRDEY